MKNIQEIEIDFTNYSINTPEFSLNGFCTNGRLVDIIDGDSLTIILPLFNNFYKYHVRLCGIDTCEMKSKNKENKDLAIKARNTLLELVVDKKYISTPKSTLLKKDIQEILDKNIIIVFVECFDFDKYGRLLANVYIKKDDLKINLSEYLLQHKLAYKYTGDTKLTEKEQLEILN